MTGAPGRDSLAGRPSPLVLLVSQAVFFTSGFAALLYQTVWHRLLAFFGGADVYSVTFPLSPARQ